MSHGGDIYSHITKEGGKLLDFSANINPLGLPKSVKEILKKEIEAFTPYPDLQCGRLKKTMEETEGFLKEELLFGNGAADLIYRLVYAKNPKKALLLAPTFSEYEIALKNIKCEISYYNLRKERGFHLEEDFLDKIKELKNLDIIFLCNPNNPTGVIITKEMMEKIAILCEEKGIILVIDECFMDFVRNQELYSMKSEFRKYKNLLILKAFTKTYAMAGLRLGYVISCNRDLLEKMIQIGPPWNVSTPAQLAGIMACQEIEYLKKTIDYVEAERTYLLSELKKLGMITIFGYSNFILFQTPEDIENYLKEQDILIRSCKDYRGLDHTYYRIAVRTREENQRLIGVLKNGKDYYGTRNHI